jgi:D-arabinose 1-dehydrogenase-like Zn-dependent alcohol dehydrogenase
MEGSLARPKLPLILGHEVVGRIVEVGPGADRFQTGARVGIPWLGWTCGECRYCRSGRENLCEKAKFPKCMTRCLTSNAVNFHGGIDNRSGAGSPRLVGGV